MNQYAHTDLHNHGDHNPAPAPSQQKDFFEMMHSRQAFWLGFITAVLSLGTIGFIILGSQMLSSGSALALNTAPAAAAPAAAAPNAPSAAPEPEILPAGSVPAVTAADHVKGPDNAKVTIIEYSDFECPFCSRFHPTVQQAVDTYGDDVRWVYRHFPLSFHPNAAPAANASECAGEQGKFWEYGDALFENQSSLNETTYKRLAAELGLNVNQFNNCVDSGKYNEKVEQQAAEGGAAGVTGTPGSFIIDTEGNATPIRGALPYSSVAAAIDAILS